MNQQTRPLFPSDENTGRTPRIPGLTYYANYIDGQLEAELIQRIDAEPWDTTWKRRRQLYGRDYGKQTRDRPPIPRWANVLVERLHDEGISERPFDQMLVNEYCPGQGISMHRDYLSFDRTVVSLSLLSRCIMDFYLEEANLKASLLLEPRSLLILSDDARYKWQHGIAARKSDRWQHLILPRSRRLSITFRLYKPRD
jgi:alkylated DNA repair dioxygenase AlkB